MTEYGSHVCTPRTKFIKTTRRVSSTRRRRSGETHRVQVSVLSHLANGITTAVSTSRSRRRTIVENVSWTRTVSFSSRKTWKGSPPRRLLIIISKHRLNVNTLSYVDGLKRISFHFVFFFFFTWKKNVLTNRPLHYERKVLEL